jgi:hypothetical protein
MPVARATFKVSQICAPVHRIKTPLLPVNFQFCMMRTACRKLDLIQWYFQQTMEQIFFISSLRISNLISHHKTRLSGLSRKSVELIHIMWLWLQCRHGNVTVTVVCTWQCDLTALWIWQCDCDCHVDMAMWLWLSCGHGNVTVTVVWTWQCDCDWLSCGYGNVTVTDCRVDMAMWLWLTVVWRW